MQKPITNDLATTSNDEVASEEASVSQVVEPVPVIVQDDGLGLSDCLNIAMLLATIVSLGIAAYATWQNAKSARESSEHAQDAADQMEDIASASQSTMWTVRDQLDRLENMMATGTKILGGLDDVTLALFRPRMNAYLGSPTHEKGFFPLVVENVGKTPARNVTVKFNPPLPEPDVDRLNANTSELMNYQKSPVEMTLAKYEGKTFKTWAPNQSTSVPFWATKFERLPQCETGKSSRFVNDDGSPADATLVRVYTDGAMLLDESADGIPADVEVIIRYEDGNGKEFEDSVSLNPDLWVATPFRSQQHHSSITTYSGSQ